MPDPLTDVPCSLMSPNDRSGLFRGLLVGFGILFRISCKNSGHHFGRPLSSLLFASEIVLLLEFMHDCSKYLLTIWRW